MKQTAVEWLEQEIFRRYKFTLQQLNCQPLEEALQQAKEMEKQQQDEFAIEFADWLTYNRENNYTKSIKELLEIYKKDNL